MFILSSLNTVLTGTAWLFKFIVDSSYAKPLILQHDTSPLSSHLTWDANNPHLFAPDKAKNIQNVDVIVIGSGPSGMMCAGYFAKQGKKVVVLEQHHRIGGGFHSFEHGGYLFNGNLHLTSGDPSVIKMVDYLSEGRVQWFHGDSSFFRYIHSTGEDKYEFEYKSDTAEFVTNLKEQHPGDVGAIDTFLETCKYCTQWFPVLTMYYTLPRGLFWLKWILWWIIPRMFKTLSTSSIETYLSSITTNRKLIDTLSSQFMYVGRSPSETSMMSYALCIDSFVRHGVVMPTRGARSVPLSIVPTIRKSGGDVFGKAFVDKILIRDGWCGRYAYGVRVMDISGNAMEMYAPVVISSAGIFNTYGHMVPDSMRNDYDLSNLKLSSSCVAAFIGFDDTAQSLDLPNKCCLHHFPSRSSRCVDVMVGEQERTLQFSHDMAFYSSVAAHDPSNRDGLAHCEVISFMDYDMLSGMGPTHCMYGGALIGRKVRKPKDEYDLFKEIIGEELLADLYEMYPKLNGHVRFVEIGTPLTCQFYLASPRGCVYSTFHAYYYYDDVIGADRNPAVTPYAPLAVDTGVRGFYCTGQDTLLDGVGMSMICHCNIMTRKWFYEWAHDFDGNHGKEHV